MYKKTIIIASLGLQLIASWFLLTRMVFADSRANWLEFSVYLFLSVLPYGIALAIYLRKKNIKQSIFIGIGSYVLAAFILSLLDGINDFYVTGMGGVGITRGISVMTLHAVILFLAIFFLSRKEEQNKALKKQFPIILLCLIAVFFLFGFFKTFALNIRPNSDLALGYLDIKETLSEAWITILFGFLNIFLNLKVLFIAIAYAVTCLCLITLREKMSNQHISFGKKLMIFFTPIWIYVGIYTTVHQQEIKENLTHNFANFQPVWNHRSLIQPYTIQFNNTSIVVWCDNEPKTTDQSVVCDNRLKVTIANEPVEIDENVYPKALDVGMFEKIPLYSEPGRSCIYTKNSAIINGILFLVSTMRCNPRNFPVLARIEWDEFILPLLQCFGSENCQIPKTRY